MSGLDPSPEEVRRQVQLDTWSRGWWTARTPYVCILALFYITLWCEALIVNASILSQFTLDTLEADTQLTALFSTTRDLLWTMSGPLTDRIRGSSNDFSMLAGVASLINCGAWYALLPYIVLKHLQLDVLLRALVTLSLAFVINLAVREPLPAEATDFASSGDWYVYGMGPVVLPAHTVVAPRLGLTWVILWEATFLWLKLNPDVGCKGVGLVLLTTAQCVIVGTFTIASRSCHTLQLLLSVSVATSTLTPITYLVAFTSAMYDEIHKRCYATRKTGSHSAMAQSASPGVKEHLELSQFPIKGASNGVHPHIIGSALSEDDEEEEEYNPEVMQTSREERQALDRLEIGNQFEANGALP
jgi:hypothetical protein